MIIMSCVRSNRKGSLGFLKDPRRMNVALTRARKALFIIADTNTLNSDHNWSAYFTWAKGLGLI